jgi:hypothetical protein
MTKYWALFANPKNYRIEEAIQNREIDLWPTSGSDLAISDRVLIWKARGRDLHRGMIALGEVVSIPEIRPDMHNPYWIKRDMAEKAIQRVAVRYIQSPHLPFWVGDPGDQVLLELPVAHARAGTVFKVTAEQWNSLMNRIGGWPADEKR